jgi:hypothetical protein
VSADVSGSHAASLGVDSGALRGLRRGLNISKYMRGAHLARSPLVYHRTTRPYRHGDGGLVINPPRGWPWRSIFEEVPLLWTFTRCTCSRGVEICKNTCVARTCRDRRWSTIVPHVRNGAVTVVSPLMRPTGSRGGRCLESTFSAPHKLNSRDFNLKKMAKNKFRAQA